jgi:hypothetical protein
MMSDQDHFTLNSELFMDSREQQLYSPWKLFDFSVGNLTPQISKWVDQGSANSHTHHHDDFLLDHPHISPSLRSAATTVSHEEAQIPDMSTVQVPGVVDANDSKHSASASLADDQERFRSFHEEKWQMRYKELVYYKRSKGDCLVPHSYQSNPQLGRWVKRQRRQYKLLKDGAKSTMTPERIQLLEDLGFVWDSHEATFQERLEELSEYRQTHGTAVIDGSDAQNKQLYTWVKGMRRQYKLYWQGKNSSMTPERIEQLEKAGFEWEVRPANRKERPSGSEEHQPSGSEEHQPSGSEEQSSGNDFSLFESITDL